MLIPVHHVILLLHNHVTDLRPNPIGHVEQRLDIEEEDHHHQPPGAGGDHIVVAAAGISAEGDRKTPGGHLKSLSLHRPGVFNAHVPTLLPALLRLLLTHSEELPI